MLADRLVDNISECCATLVTAECRLHEKLGTRANTRPSRRPSETIREKPKFALTSGRWTVAINILNLNLICGTQCVIVRSDCQSSISPPLINFNRFSCEEIRSVITHTYILFSS